MSMRILRLMSDLLCRKHKHRSTISQWVVSGTCCEFVDQPFLSHDTVVEKSINLARLNPGIASTMWGAVCSPHMAGCRWRISIPGHFGEGMQWWEHTHLHFSWQEDKKIQMDTLIAAKNRNLLWGCAFTEHLRTCFGPHWSMWNNERHAFHSCNKPLHRATLWLIVDTE